jgi:pantothenate kinase
VIVEGNYLLLDEKPWNEISKLFDEKWYLQIDLDVAMERVRLRHIAELSKCFFIRFCCLLLKELSPEKALERIATNDRINAELIDKRRVQPDRIIHIKPNDHKH